MSAASDYLFPSDDLPEMDRHLLSSNPTGFNTRTPYRRLRTTVSASKRDPKLHVGAIISIGTRSPVVQLKYVCRVRRSTLNLGSAARAFLSALMLPGTDTMSISLVTRLDPKLTIAAPPTSAHLMAEPRSACETALKASSIGLTGERLRGRIQGESVNRRSKVRKVSKKSGKETSNSSSRRSIGDGGGTGDGGWGFGERERVDGSDGGGGGGGGGGIEAD
jgi:hypothetical protein